MIYAGTSGYSFREWVGRFYPEKTKAKDYLSYYGSQLNSVEINHTFRRFPRAEVSDAWARATPESFRFAIKMHQSVTHRYRLREVGRSVNDFLAELKPLGERLGVVLFQLPPFFKIDLERLERFLSELPGAHRFAIEFRHPSWEDPTVHERLRGAGVALCAAEVEIEATEIRSTAPFAYLRLRRPPPYDPEETRRVRELLNQVAGEVEDIYLYAKHDDEGLAPETVKKLRAV